jgi:hypothetical protein
MSKLIAAAEFPIILLAGILGQKVAAKLWSAVLKSDPPDTSQEDVRWSLLLAAAVVEGTLYKLARMAVERSLRTSLARATGSWPAAVGKGE